MAKPAMPATRPWSSAWAPSEAETCEREISSSLIGSAPIWRIFARSWADWIVKPPEICAPVEPSMPSGFSWKLMNGFETSWSSSTIAKLCEAWSAGTPGSVLSAPRWAILRVIDWNALRPLSVKSNVTIGWPPPRLVEVLLRVLEVRAGERGTVEHDPPPVGRRRLLAVLADRGLLVAHDEHALG